METKTTNHDFNENELEMVYQYAAYTKAETIAGLQEIVPVIKDDLTRGIVASTIGKLQKIPELECSCFIADIKATFLRKRDEAIQRRIAESEERK